MLRKLVYAFIWIVLMAGPARAGDMSVACAVNFTEAMKELARLYVAQTGEPVQCTFGSTRNLCGQIENGAPFDLFLAADEDGPAMLHERGLAQPPVTYAKGTVVLWTANQGLASLTDWKNVLTSPAVNKIGIASPQTAAYGKRAVEAMTSTSLYGRVETKLTVGKNVEAAFLYARNGMVDAAFVGLSQALSSKGTGGKYWIVAEAQNVRHAACVLNHGQPESAERFLQWMRTADARAIIGKYGYI